MEPFAVNFLRDLNTLYFILLRVIQSGLMMKSSIFKVHAFNFFNDEAFIPFIRVIPFSGGVVQIL
jgi:hypothetical protein